VSRRVVDLTVTDAAYAAHLAAAGLPWRRLLSDRQRDGLLCIDCEADAATMAPVGSCDEGLVFVCGRCYAQIAARIS